MNGQAVETVANSRLADTAPALAGAAVVLLIVLPLVFLFAWRVLRESSRAAERIAAETGAAIKYMTDQTGRWMERHEGVEAGQFQKVDRAHEVGLRVEAKVDRLHDKMDDLADRIDRREMDPLPHAPGPDPKAPRGR